MLLTLSVLAPLLAAPVAWWLVRTTGERIASWFWLLPALLFTGYAGLLPTVLDGQARVESWDWIPSLGVAFALRADGLSLLFALLISGIGAFIFLYAARYLAGHADLGRFYARLILFMAVMLGAVLADDFMTLLVF